MRKLVALLLTLLSQSLFAQTHSDELAQIKTAVKQINLHKNYVKKTLVNEAFMPHMTDGGGQLTGYFRNGRLVKVVEWVGLSSCINTTEYYFQNNQLIFAFTQGKMFEYDTRKQSFNPAVQNVTLEAKFYFSGAKVLKYLIKGETICSGKPQPSWAKEYENNSKLYKRLLSIK